MIMCMLKLLKIVTLDGISHSKTLIQPYNSKWPKERKIIIQKLKGNKISVFQRVEILWSFSNLVIQCCFQPSTGILSGMEKSIPDNWSNLVANPQEW